MTMMPRFLLTAALAAATFCPATDGFAQAEDARALLQQGLFAEEAQQKLDAAAEHYGRIIADYEARRDYAATALYRLAEVRRKQGRNEDAAALYQRLIAEFPGAEPQARLSRENLAAMGIEVAPPAAAGMAMPPDPDEDRELRRLMMLAANSPERVWENVKPELPPNVSGPDISPLANAAYRGWLRVATWLLEHPEGAGEQPLERDMPLYRAAELGHLDVCKFLHEKGAKFDPASSALVLAILRGYDPVASWLVENGADIDHVGQGHLVATGGPIRKHQDWETRQMVNGPPRIVAQLTPLAAAIAADNLKWTERLIELGAKPEGEGDHLSALSVACWKGHPPLVRRLLEMGADPNAADNLGMDAQYLRQLETNSPGWTPLHYAASNSEIVKLLLDAGANPNAADQRGITPLHCAAYRGSIETVNLLIEAGADVHAKGSISKGQNDDGQLRDAFDFAGERSDFDTALAMLFSLVEAGVDPLEIVASEKGRFATRINSIVARELAQPLCDKFLIPTLLSKQDIFVAVVPSGIYYRIATREGEEDPPSFAKALLPWARLAMTDRDVNFTDFKNSRILRSQNGAEPQAIPFDPFAEENYPPLAWGDVIALPTLVDSPQLDQEDILFKGFLDSLEGSETVSVSVQDADGNKRDVVINNGISIAVPPWNEAGFYTLFGGIAPLAHPKAQQIEYVEVQRGDETLPASSLSEVDGSLKDGDLVKIVKSTDRLDKAQIFLVEPIGGAVVAILAKRRPQRVGEGRQLPTLFQFLAWSYSVAEVGASGDNIPSETVLRGKIRNSYVGGLVDGRWVKEKRCGIIAHPDFSSLRIRRQSEGGAEEVIQAPLTEWVAACGSEATAEQCRAFDVELQPGDVVELSPIVEKSGQPWSGFEDNVARFLEKALSFEVIFRGRDNSESRHRFEWKAPRFIATKAGPVAIRDENAMGFQAGKVWELLADPKNQSVPEMGWVRDGMVIDAEPATISVVGREPRSDGRRRVVLPSRALESEGPRPSVIVPRQPKTDP